MPINVNLPPNGASGGDVRAVRAQPLGAEEKKGRADQAGERDQLEGSSSKKWLTVHTTRFPGLWELWIALTGTQSSGSGGPAS